MPGPVVDGLALAVTAAGLLAAGATLRSTRRPQFALKVLLDFLLAAGLLRLTGQPGWPALVIAAAIVAVRRLIGVGLRAGRGPADLLRRPAGSALVPTRRRL